MLESLDTESVAEKERLDSAAMLGKGAREEDAQQRRKVRARKKNMHMSTIQNQERSTERV